MTINDFITIGAIAMLIYGVVVCSVVAFDLVTGRWKRFVPKRTADTRAPQANGGGE